MLRTNIWEAFALTEHAFALAIPEHEGPWPAQWFHQPERLWAYRAFREEKTDKLMERYAQVCDGKRIFSGLEVEVDCNGDLSMEALLWPYLDIVIGSVHYLPGTPDTWIDSFILQTEQLLAYPIDILGHPFRQLASSVEVPDEIIDETLRLARQAGVAVEINAHIPFVREAHVLRRAVQMGVDVSFGLDAHGLHELQLHTFFEQMVRDSGVSEDDIMLFSPQRKTPLPRSLVR